MNAIRLKEAIKIYLDATPPPRSRKGSIAWDELRAAIAESEADEARVKRDFLP